MRDISEIDHNFAIKSNIDGVNLCSYNVRNAPFKIYGLMQGNENDPFHRLPDDVAKATSESVAYLHTNTAGGRVRFSTNSRHISIHADMPGKCLMYHMAF